jgi:hypothetical protein
MRLDMAQRPRPTRDAVEILRRRYYAGKPGRLKNLEEARGNQEIARKICELRTAAGLTQGQLAKLCPHPARKLDLTQQRQHLAESRICGADAVEGGLLIFQAVPIFGWRQLRDDNARPSATTNVLFTDTDQR